MDCDEDNNNRDDDDDNYSDDDDVFMDQPASQVSAIHDSQPSSSKEIVQKSSTIFLLGLKESFKLTNIFARCYTGCDSFNSAKHQHVKITGLHIPIL